MTVTLRDISKSYPRKTVLDHVSLTFCGARIHALLGENGAGKSTLVGILCGALQADSGTILIDGSEVHFASQAQALSHGITMVQQTPLLAPELTAQENISLSGAHKKEQVASLFEQWAPEISMREKIRDMGGNKRFYVALVRELLKHPAVLVLDEPSAFLDASERKTLYGRLRHLAESGMNVIVITHSAAEAAQYCDTTSVLKDGQVQEPERESLLHTEKHDVRAVTTGGGSACLSLEHVTVRHKHFAPLTDICLTADYGTITAVTGMQEPALETLELLATGMLHGARSAGTVTLCGTKTDLSRKRLSAQFLRAHKTAIVPSDRKYTASDPGLTVDQMLFTAGTGHEECIQDAGIAITLQEKAEAMSGGMLQRLILSREKSLGGPLFILCNPMQALDAKSQKALVGSMLSLASEGKAVLVLGAEDIPLTLCGRVYEMEAGTCTLAFQKQ